MATTPIGRKITKVVNSIEKLIKAAQEIKQELEELGEKPPKTPE